MNGLRTCRAGCWESSSRADIIDVCSLAPDSRSIAALSRDGEILFLRDVFSETEEPIPFRFSAVEGTAYRILSLLGHLIVLTNRSVYVLENLGRRFLEGHPLHREPTGVASFPMEAVDISQFDDAHLLVVLPDAVTMIDLKDLLADMTGTKPNGAVDRLDFGGALAPIATDGHVMQRSATLSQEPLQISA